ncbi:MAG: hypothetical protein LBU89_03320 [Fibromonadaceae bacterium]|jgi:NH3-dependent NAD+ synthetase|nr:hypothetical protein [Fibromonadaceae bacterium]
MEQATIELLMQFGVSGGMGTTLVLVAKHALGKRDAEIAEIKESFQKHLSKHEGFEEKIYNRLNPIAESVKKIEGFLEAQQMMALNQRGKQ